MVAMRYKDKRNFDNAQKRIFKGVGKYEIPVIQPARYSGCEWIGFNQAGAASQAERKRRHTQGVHFFLDDYQFQRVWLEIDRYIPMLLQYKYVMSPDFSLYRDFPKIQQIWNHYRKHWIAAYLQESGAQVIPTICWSVPESFTWCFDGEPEHSVVAISTVGTRKNKESSSLFNQGFQEMLKRLKPVEVLCYGSAADIEDTGCKITEIPAFHKSFEELADYFPLL